MIRVFLNLKLQITKIDEEPKTDSKVSPNTKCYLCLDDINEGDNCIKCCNNHTSHYYCFEGLFEYDRQKYKNCSYCREKMILNYFIKKRVK